MNKIIGLLLVGLSLLTSAIVISLGQISKAIKQAKAGNFGIDSALLEIPVYVYLIIVIAVCLGIYLINSRNDH